MTEPATFDEMAVALALAAGKAKMDVDQLDLVGARIGLSDMGLALCRAELQKNVDLIAAAHELLKSLAPHEQDVRAIAVADKPKLRILRRIASDLSVKKVAAIAAACIVLAACEGKDVARARNEQKLPPGCRIIDLDYGELRAAVVCDGRKTTTQLREWQQTTMQPSGGGQVPVTYTYSQMSAVIEP